MSGRPALSPSGVGTTSPRAVRLTPELAKAVDERRAEDGVSFSEIVRRALESYLEQPR